MQRHQKSAEQNLRRESLIIPGSSLYQQNIRRDSILNTPGLRRDSVLTRNLLIQQLQQLQQQPAQVRDQETLLQKGESLSVPLVQSQELAKTTGLLRMQSGEQRRLSIFAGSSPIQKRRMSVKDLSSGPLILVAGEPGAGLGGVIDEFAESEEELSVREAGEEEKRIEMGERSAVNVVRLPQQRIVLEDKVKNADLFLEFLETDPE